MCQKHLIWMASSEWKSGFLQLQNKNNPCFILQHLQFFCLNAKLSSQTNWINQKFKSAGLWWIIFPIAFNVFQRMHNTCYNRCFCLPYPPTITSAFDTAALQFHTFTETSSYAATHEKDLDGISVWVASVSKGRLAGRNHQKKISFALF